MDRAQTSAANPAVRGPDDVRALILASAEADLRVEHWIAGRLDGDGQRTGPSTWPVRLALESKGMLGRGRPNLAVGAGSHPGWNRIRVETRDDTIVISPVDSQLINELALSELRGEFLAVCSSGSGRIVLNLAQVDRISSQFLELLVALDLHCARSPGGRLKLCGVSPELGRLLSISGLDRRFQIFSDLTQAMNGPWPFCPKTIPLEILGELIHRPRPADDREPVDPPTPSRDQAQSLPSDITCLRIRVEGREARLLSIPEGGLRIGRDRPCEVLLRDRSVSRLHAWIGLRDGRFVLEDLGSTNGTRVDGRVIRSEVMALRPGACVLIGSIRFELTDPSTPIVEAILSEWSTEDPGPDRGPGNGSRPDQVATDTDLFEAGTSAKPAVQPVRRETIEGVLILSPTVPRLDDEATVGPIRDSIDEVLLEAGPRTRLVVNLAHLVTLSGRGIGLLLALQLRLRRQGGTLRLAQASPMVSTAMEVVGVPKLIETFTTIEDAVLTCWNP